MSDLRMKSIDAAKVKSRNSNRPVVLHLKGEKFLFEAGKAVEYERHVAIPVEDLAGYRAWATAGKKQ